MHHPRLGSNTGAGFLLPGAGRFPQACPHSSLHIAAPALKTGPAAVPRYRAGLAFPY